jgi:hypothetical protein
MPYFTYPLSPEGPVVPALIGLNDQDTAALVRAGQPVPRPVSVRALLDTAADGTCIPARVAQQLGLSPSAQVMMQTASGTHKVNTYEVSLSVVGPPGAVSGLLVWPAVDATELTVSLSNVDVLIGLDVLRQSLFILNGPADQFLLGQ